MDGRVQWDGRGVHRGLGLDPLPPHTDIPRALTLDALAPPATHAHPVDARHGRVELRRLGHLVPDLVRRSTNPLGLEAGRAPPAPHRELLEPAAKPPLTRL